MVVIIMCFFLFVLHQMNKNSLSEIEKREKRAMERKLSEMEEELKVSVYHEHTHNLIFQ